MKTRQGFVSNSSSSSFVLLGFKINKFANETLKFDDDGEVFLFSKDGEEWKIDYDEVLSDNDLIGFKIADDSELEFTDTTFEELDNIATQLSEDFKIDKNRIKLYTGTRSC